VQRKSITLAFVAVMALACGAAFAGYPVLNYLPPEAVAALGALGGMPFAMSGEVTLLEVKKVIEDQGKAFDEFKKANDELIKAKAEGKAVADLEAKVATLQANLDKYADLKEALEELQKKANRPDPGTDNASKAAAEELKSFNIAARADYQSKGRTYGGDMDAKTYGDYKSAFFKVAAGVQLAHLSGDEQKALQAGSDPDGGYLLPHSTVGRMVTKLFEQSVMRQICDVQTISTDKIEGVLDLNEADAGWVSELGTRSDTTTPQVGKWEIQAHEMYAMPKASQKILDDAATDVEGWLAGKVADKFARVEGTAFWAGTGTGQPRGLGSYTTAATADGSRAWGQFEHVLTGANGAFHTTKLDPLQDLQGAFKDHFLQNAQWVMRREARTALRKMKEATSDRYLWEPSNQVGQPDRLNGYPVRVDQYMATIATGSLSVAFGDFRQAYTIVDRMGIRTLRDPFTAKPYVVFYSTKRTGGGAMNYEAVKFLKFSA
jgi:HK97 family phage major capsid protein